MFIDRKRWRNQALNKIMCMYIYIYLFIHMYTHREVHKVIPPSYSISKDRCEEAMSRWYNQLPDAAQSQAAASKRFETRLQAL